MSNLSINDKNLLTTFLQMKGGFVLDFTDKTFKELILESVSIDIYEDKYNQTTSGKAARLKAFWDIEANHIVGKVISTLLDYWKTQKLTKQSQISPSEQALFDACYQISERIKLDNQRNQVADKIATSVHFEQIQKSIIEQITLAKFTIWVAVAWFTDKVLFEHLVTKKNQGINVQLIIIDDDTNRTSGLMFEDKFETYRKRKHGTHENNIMHYKFCVIDSKTVIEGSYNWTKKAQYNNEHITITSNNYEFAEKFAERFIKLKTQ